MIEKYVKRVVACLLAMIMVFSAVPGQVFAATAHDHENEDTTKVSDQWKAPAKFGESEALVALRTEIAAYIKDLGITPDMPDQVLLEVYNSHLDYKAAQASLTKQDEFLEKGKLLSEAEQKILLAETNTKLCQRYRNVAETAYAMELMAEQKLTVNGMEFASSTGTITESGGTVTAKIKASGKSNGCGGTDYTAATMVIYITNTSAEAGSVSFAMKQTNVNSIKAGTEDIKGKTSYTKSLDAGAEFTITMTTGANGTENIVEFSNIVFTGASQAFTVTVEYPTDMGSVTSTKAGTAVESDGTTTLTIADVNAVDGVTLTANSSTFLCWVDMNNNFLSKDKTYTINPSADVAVKAVMTGGKAYFLTNESFANNNLVEGQVYGDLNQAIAGATNKKVVLMNSGTLPAGNYTIPSGVTLLIPFDDVNTLYTNAPGTTASDDSTLDLPTVYRKMTMAEGANITVNGAISLSAKQHCNGGHSSPTGACSFVDMQSGSNITVNNGGKLYVWGYITGSGTVTVKRGATVYECFQVKDWLGGDNTSSLIDNSYRVFPFSQYYVQNVEVPMTLEAGATEKGYMSVSITLVGIQGAEVPFIGSDGMFNITSGSIVKDYDETTGRLLINVDGALTVKSLSLSMKLGFLGSKTINSSKYVLPINGNMTVTMHSGGSITMTQDIMMQPGARLIVDEGATCTLGQGNKIYVYDYAEWKLSTGVENPVAEGPSYCGTGDLEYINLTYPASATTVQGRTEDAYVEINGTADLSAGYVYTTAGGANIRGSGTIIMQPGTETKTYQVKTLGSDNKDLKYVTIPITSAKLKNADGSYVSTANDLGVVTYNGATGAWVCDHECEYVEAVTTAATCEKAGVKTFTCLCGEDSYTAEIPALGHNYDAVVTAPTCTAAGYTTHTCQNGCGSTYTDAEVAALGHDEVNHAAQAPTCTEIGWDVYVTCTRCDHSTYVEKAALGHDEVNHEAKDATCTGIGWDAYVTCTRCDYSTYVEKAALGHVWEWIIDQEANFLYPGIKHEECSRCHAKQNENTEIPVLVCSHTGTLVITEAKDATCTEVGNTRYSYCSTCQNYYSDESGKNEIEKDSWIIPALGHDEVDHAGQAPTCTEIGWDAYVTCSRCEYTTYAQKAALGHDEVEHEAKAPNCKVGGWDAYVTCSRCDYSTKVELPADSDAHVWDEGEPYGNHSCNSTAYMQYKCTLCRKTNFVVVREKHFRVPIAEEIPATCTEEGMTSGWMCEKCDEFWIPQEVIPALGHDWNGNYPCQSEISACTRCDLHFETMQEHLTIVDAAIPATCTATGLSEGSHCGYCGQILVAQTETPMADHNWIVADLEIPATCNNTGHKEGANYCLDCNYDADPIPALEHEWMHREAKKATYSAVGWNAHDYCLLCKVTKTLEQFEDHPCEYCGENPAEYVEIPMVEIQKCKTLDEFLTNIGYLEQMAGLYAKEHPGTDPLGLVLNYMRTAVENYTTGSWAIMAGPEDKDFLKFVQEAEDAINSDPEVDVWVNVSGLKKLGSHKSPTNEKNYYTGNTLYVISGHFFGTMDMTYHNKGSQNHADVGGWVGDLADLLSTTDELGVDPSLTLEEKVAFIRENYLFSNTISGSAGSFGSSDLYADLEAYYFMNELITKGYETGDLEKMMREYYDSSLTLEQRVAYLLANRLDGLSTRQDLRTAVYHAYTGNKLIATLEGTRNFNTNGSELAELRKAVCYAFADEMCYHAGDYVEDLTNPRFTVFDSDTQILAPGISQQINYATNADGKQIVYYVATADVKREDVGLWVNYYDRNPGTPENPVWKNSSVPNSAQNAQDRYGDPNSVDYIPNFSVIASTNAGGYSMQEDATPGGLIVMNGVEWYPNTGSAGFFAILDDGTAYMGTHAEYETMKDQIQEAIGGFGEFVVQDGKVVGSATYSDAPRTSVGITSTGRVVIMCIDGRQAPFSSGASLEDVGYIMKEAGCVVAINLDGGGSTTFVARQPGEDDLTVMNRPSDGYPRNVSSNLLVYSTAPSSTAFDHAVVESEYDYATIGTPVQMTAAGVSPAGNAVEVPEGATWAVGNEDWASITEDGVFTGKRLGEVYVYLMLDGNVIGSKLMTLTNPDQLYFEKNKVDAIYGSSVVLPLRARFEGKPIAINPNDVTITLSVPSAGTMDGFTFVVAESEMKALSITAALNENAKATISVMLYKQGENNFDFDNATGGDRTLAWHREVTNSKVEDGNIYNVIDPSKDMVTSYTFAMDMSTIPMPERLKELSYMLPGGTVEGTNAWTFLLSLAQRISDLSWVRATIDFDDRFVVDYSELSILNEYFQMKSQEFDETTNTLTVTMSWIKQSQVIDEATANPMCLIKGIKMTPKDGVWEDAAKIDAVTSGNISYEIYMRASGLYSFAQKPESQAVFGVYPYRNPADTSDAGGYFHDTYVEITDEFTLVNVLKEGWVNEDGGFAYYVEGERLTGVQKVDGYYYDFGEKGVNVGQNKYTGMFYQQISETEGGWYYSYIGELANGWQSIDGEWYYFDTKNNQAVSGYVKLAGVKFHFEENGKLTSGVWVKTLKGTRYYYGPSMYWNLWHEIDGELYYFYEGYLATGFHWANRPENLMKSGMAYFDENGRYVNIGSGIFEIDGIYYYFEDGYSAEKGLVCVDGDYYFSVHRGRVITNEYKYAYETNCDLPCGWYEFGADGKVIGASKTGEIVVKDGIMYYYESGAGAEKGLICLNGDYYFTVGRGRVITNEYKYAYVTNCDLPCGWYEFGADGKVIGASKTGEIVEKDGTLYYYENGAGAEKGLVCVDGDYYFTVGRGRVITNEYKYAYVTNCDLPCDWYEFGADGKMLGSSKTGEIVEKDGTLYYYESGAGKEKGLICLNGDYYFTVGRGRVITNEYKYAYETNCDLPCGWYEFGADGKVIGASKTGEIVVKDGIMYYYESGAGAEKGLICLNGDYYFTVGRGRVITNEYKYAYVTNCDLPCGWYEFGADGKVIGASKTGEIVEKDGTLYYYENGAGVEKGLVCVDGDYYFTVGRGRVITNEYKYAYETNCDMPCGYYEFGADGKVIGASKTGEIVEKDGTLYYYESGAGKEKGLICLDGDYYFTVGRGRVITNEYKYAYETNCDLPCGNYEFGADGKMIGASKTGEIVVKDGTMYYYKSGAAVERGLICIDGDYYYTVGNGRIIVNETKYAYMTSCDLPCGNYEFGADGKMIGASKTGEIVVKDGIMYYYEAGVGAEKGLIYLNGDYYYTVGRGRIITNEYKYAYETSCDLPCGWYDFDADGKMIGSSKTGEIVNKDGVLYYYENGVPMSNKGLVYLDGYYYFVCGSGRLAVNCRQYVWEANGLLIEGYYTFNELGQLIG